MAEGTTRGAAESHVSRIDRPAIIRGAIVSRVGWARALPRARDRDVRVTRRAGSSPAHAPGRWSGALVAEVRDALASLHDPTRLETSPLARWMAASSHQTASSRGKALGAALRAAIESLRPERKMSAGSLAQRSYQILALRYVEALEVP